MQRIVPYLYYRDGRSALEFLSRAFGFEERLRVPRKDGSIAHAETGYGGDVVMLGTPLDREGRPNVPHSTTRHGNVVCYVDALDEHYARAKAEGATILEEPADTPDGDRRYAAADPEGHVWFFFRRKTLP